MQTFPAHPHAFGCAVTMALSSLLSHPSYRRAQIDFKHADGSTTLLRRGQPLMSYQGSFTREMVIADLKQHAAAHQEDVMTLAIDTLNSIDLPDGYHVSRDVFAAHRPSAMECEFVYITSKTSLLGANDLRQLHAIFGVSFTAPDVRFSVRSGALNHPGGVDLLGNNGLLCGEKTDTYEQALRGCIAGFKRGYVQHLDNINKRSLTAS